MVKHNKLRNVGVLFETLNSTITHNLNNSSNNDISSRLLRVIKEHYLNNTEISKTWKLYSQVLYGNAAGENQAMNYANSLIDEAAKIDYSKVNTEIDRMINRIDRVTDHKKLIKEKVDNYLLFASFKTLVDEKLKKVSLTQIDKLNCERTIVKHLLENRENVKVLKDAEYLNSMEHNEEKLSTNNLALVLAYDEFSKQYSNTLLKEQNECLEKYLTTASDKLYKRWLEKKVEKILVEIESKKEFVEDDTVYDKLEMTEQKLKNVLKEELTEDNIYVVMKAIELKENLKLF